MSALQSLLGEVDLAFLGAYAIGMFFAGHLGDRLDLRWFLSAGKIGRYVQSQFLHLPPGMAIAIWLK